MPTVKDSGSVALQPGQYPTEGEGAKKLATTRYEHWHGRLVSLPGAIFSGLRRILISGPSSSKALKIFDGLCQARKDLSDYHIACTMELHKLCKVRESHRDGESGLELAGGSRQVTESTLQNVTQTLKSSPVDLAYKFLTDDRRLPVGFLDRALIPHFVEYCMHNFGVKEYEAEAVVYGIAQRESLVSDDSVTFERILEMKNGLKAHFSTPVSARTKIEPPANIALNMENPALTPPALDIPKPTHYELDGADKEYIQSVVNKGTGIKIPKHDLLVRLKRFVLRNKRDIAMNTLGVVFSAVLTGVSTGGIAAAVNILYYLGWYAVWSGGTEAIRMAKAVRAMQEAEMASDFKLEPNELGILSEMDEKKFRMFMKSLRYVCSHETLTRIYHAYGDMEKDAYNRLGMKEDDTTLDSVIRLEEGKARYLYRRDNLSKSFDAFKRLYQTATSDYDRIGQEWDKHLDTLWENKFSRMPSMVREKLFTKAANDSRVKGRFYHFQTNKSDWLHSIFPKMNEVGVYSEEDEEKAYEAYQKMIDEEMPEEELTEEERSRFNKHADRVASTFAMAKNGIHSYLMGWVNSSFKATVSHAFKVGWHGIIGARQVEILPALPKPSLDGVVIFAFFFMADVFINRLNTAVNRERFKKIQKKEKAYTGFGPWRRERTGREEIATMRKLSKDNLPEFVERVFQLQDTHKKLLEELRMQDELSRLDPDSRPFQYMDDYEAAVLVLKHKYHQQMVSEMMTGAIGEYYRNVISKTDFLDEKLSNIISPQTAL